MGSTLVRESPSLRPVCLTVQLGPFQPLIYSHTPSKPGPGYHSRHVMYTTNHDMLSIHPSIHLCICSPLPTEPRQLTSTTIFSRQKTTMPPPLRLACTIGITILLGLRRRPLLRLRCRTGLFSRPPLLILSVRGCGWGRHRHRWCGWGCGFRHRLRSEDLVALDDLDQKVSCVFEPVDLAQARLEELDVAQHPGQVLLVCCLRCLVW